MGKLVAAITLLTAITASGCVFNGSGIAINDSVFADSGCGENCNNDQEVDSTSIDVSKTDFVKPVDSLKPDGQTLDAKIIDDILPDTLLPDTLTPDTLKPDTRNLCTGIECSHGTCDPKTGKCMCDTGFAGIGCDKCPYAYGPYPTCTALLPTVTIKINCNSPCNKFSTTKVNINFTNALTFRTQLDCVSGTCMGNPPAKGTVTPPSGNLPTTTTNTLTKHTINWTFGSSGPTDLRIRVFVTGPGGTKEDNKSIALSP